MPLLGRGLRQAQLTGKKRLRIGPTWPLVPPDGNAGVSPDDRQPLASIGYAPDDPHGGPCVICASCGTENRTGSRFCDNCGAPLASNCPTCGEPNRADARFCANCGSALDGDASTASAP